MSFFEGKAALVTGGVSGIGWGLAKALLSSGATVAVGYRREEDVEPALATIGAEQRDRVLPVRLDVLDRDLFIAAADEVERVFGKIHILCNNAGVNLFGPMDLATFDDWDWVFGVNLGGVINGIVTVLPRIKAHGEGGHILNVASMASFLTGPEAGIYTASKFAVRGLTECLHFNLAAQGIGVSMLAPALTATNIYRAPLRRPENYANSGYELNQNQIERIAKLHALGMDPDEVGRRAMAGIQNNDLYIFSHPGYGPEFEAACKDVVAAFPDGFADPGLANMEAGRVARRAAAVAQGRSLGAARSEMRALAVPEPR